MQLTFDSDIDSLAFGREGTVLEDLLFVSHNAGRVGSTGAAAQESELTMVDVATLKRVALARGGTRGDVVFATSDGRVLISQTDQVDVLSPAVRADRGRHLAGGGRGRAAADAVRDRASSTRTCSPAMRRCPAAC